MDGHYNGDTHPHTQKATKECSFWRNRSVHSYCLVVCLLSGNAKRLATECHQQTEEQISIRRIFQRCLWNSELICSVWIPIVLRILSCWNNWNVSKGHDSLGKSCITKQLLNIPNKARNSNEWFDKRADKHFARYYEETNGLIKWDGMCQEHFKLNITRV